MIVSCAVEDDLFVLKDCVLRPGGSASVPALFDRGVSCFGINIWTSPYYPCVVSLAEPCTNPLPSSRTREVGRCVGGREGGGGDGSHLHNSCPISQPECCHTLGKLAAYVSRTLPQSHTHPSQ